MIEEDRRGVMFAVSNCLDELDVNIVSLSSNVKRAQARAACGMMSFAISLPEGLTHNEVQAAIEDALERLGVLETERSVRLAPHPHYD